MHNLRVVTDVDSTSCADGNLLWHMRRAIRQRAGLGMI